MWDRGSRERGWVSLKRVQWWVARVVGKGSVVGASPVGMAMETGGGLRSERICVGSSNVQVMGWGAAGQCIVGAPGPRLQDYTAAACVSLIATGSLKPGFRY